MAERNYVSIFFAVMLDNSNNINVHQYQLGGKNGLKNSKALLN